VLWLRQARQAPPRPPWPRHPRRPPFSLIRLRCPRHHPPCAPPHTPWPRGSLNGTTARTPLHLPPARCSIDCLCIGVEEIIPK
jgi:hypothetical protein